MNSIDSPDDDERTRARAVDQLVDLGLTEYGAKCFVALTRLSAGAAKEVSQLSGVPNSRVYDALEGLHERGFVEVEKGSPRRYRAVPVDDVFTQLRRRYRARIESLSETFDGLTAVDGSDGEQGIWTIRSREHVLAREATLIRNADDEVVFRLGAVDALSEDSIEHLAAADDDVSVRVEVPTESLRDRLRERLPGAEVSAVDPPSTGEEAARSVGRIVLVDGEAALVSTYAGTFLPDAPRETAVWAAGGDGPATGFVHSLRALVEA